MQAQRPRLPLRKGGDADVRRALGFLEGLDLLLSRRPSEFQALLAIAEGRPEEARPESVASLQQAAYLTPEGTMLPEYAAVLVSAYEVVPDGPTLAMPFDLQAEGAREIIDRVQRKMHGDLRKFLRDDDSGGRSR